jgi:hypothetical protein
MGLSNSETAARQTVDEATYFLRRLIPFPSAETVSPISLIPMPGGRASADPVGAVPSNQLNATAGVVNSQAASIVSMAASVLDEEMAKGVLAARAADVSAPYGRPDANNPVLRQMHEFVNNLAALWPSLQQSATQPFAASQPAASEPDALAEVRPRTTVKRGERATIAMTLCNSESRRVHLVPAATDLLGSIEASRLEISPAELDLEPQGQHELAIATTVPADAAPGCYSGLLVVRGLDYLRALITIEVV